MSLKCTIKSTLILMYLLSNHAFSSDYETFVKLTEKNEPNSSVEFTLHSNEGNEATSHEYLVFNIPFPPGYLSSEESISLTHKNKEISYFSEPLLWWKSTQTKNNHSIRALRVIIKNEKNVFPYDLSLKITTANTKLLNKPNSIKIFKTSQHNLKGPSPEADKILKINLPYIYPVYTSEWLSRCLLRSKSLPIESNSQLKWFDSAFINFTDSFINAISNRNSKIDNISLINSEPWMYDLPSTLFTAYFKTGKLKYLQQAHITSQIYASQISPKGHFALKKSPDIKFSYNLSMFLDYLLFGDESLLKPIEAVANFTSNWKLDYKFSDSFWTERHQTYSLLGSLVAWEATGENSHLIMAKIIAKATMHEVRNPENNWEPQGCVLHTIRSHEGDNDDRPACSPWMSALLSEAMFRYYIITGDKEALTFIFELAEFIANYGIYRVTNERHLNGIYVPWYLASREVQYTDNGPWDDREHACDVAGLLARGAWAAVKIGAPNNEIKRAISKILPTCQNTFKRWFRASKSSKMKYWKNSPPRKYSWWFGSTSDLTYFLSKPAIYK